MQTQMTDNRIVKLYPPMATFPGVPKNEIVWVQYMGTDKMPAFLETSNMYRDTYFLYELTGETYNKLGKARTPLELRDKYQLERRLGGAV